MLNHFAEEELSTIWKLSTVVWELTSQCNLSCGHCGSSAGPTSGRALELSFEESQSVVKDLNSLGTKRIVFSGGEPFLSPHWESLAKYVIDLGIKVSFVSNGLLINQQLICRFLNLGNGLAIGVSLDGARANTHDTIRRSPGLFHRVLKAINDLVDHKVPVSVITTVHKENFNELDDLWKLLQGTGIYAWQIQPAMPVGRLSNRYDFVLDGEGLYTLAKFISMKRVNCNFRVEAGDNVGYFGPFEASLRSKTWSGCKAGISVAGIKSNGDVIGCLSLQGTPPEGNVRTMPINKIWRDPKAFIYNRNFKLDDLKGQCRTCEYGSICKGGCSFFSYSFTNEYHNIPICIRNFCTEAESVVVIG